jgi:hypothetical protein
MMASRCGICGFLVCVCFDREFDGGWTADKDERQRVIRNLKTDS